MNSSYIRQVYMLLLVAIAGAWLSYASAQVQGSSAPCLAGCYAPPCGLVTTATTGGLLVGGARLDDELPEPVSSIMPALARLTLSEQQEDAVFAIVHAASPSVRQGARQMVRLRSALRELAASSGYTEAVADPLIRALAEATARAARLNAQMAHEIIQVLTPEQRLQMHDIQHSLPVLR
jgi:hypothetical protein